MLTSFEVGAVLKVWDEASPAMIKIATRAKELDGLFVKLNEKIKLFNENVLKIGTGSSEATKLMIENFARVDSSLDIATASAKGLTAQLARAAEAARGISVRSIAGSGGGGAPPGIRNRGHGGGIHGPRFHANQSGVHAGSMGLPSTPLMAAGAILGYGVFEAAKAEDTATQILYHVGLPYTRENKDKFIKIIQSTMSSTGASMDDVSESALTGVRMFKGTPGGGIDVLPEIMKSAAIEARLKGTSLQDAMQSFIGLAHMTKEYSPEQITKLAPAFAFLSSANPSSLGSMERAASYAVPILQSGLGIDPEDSLLLGTALTRAGATNTKSGTWLRNMALAAMPGTSVMSKMAFKKHEEALKSLGLVDDHNQPTWFTDGKPDLFKMIEIAGQKAGAVPVSNRAAYEKQLFGTQGFGAFALLSDPAVRQQIQSLKGEMNSPEFKSRYANFLDQYNKNSPMQAGRQAWADTQNALMDLGKTLLPSVANGIKGFDDGLKQSEQQWTRFTTAMAPAINAVQGFGGAVLGAMNFLSNPRGEGRKPQDDPGAAHRRELFEKLNPSGNLKQGALESPNVHIKTAVYLDKRLLGEALSRELASLSTFPTQAPYSNSFGGWNSPDDNFATG